MSDLELLWLVVLLLYGWECACWIPRESVAILKHTGRLWRVLWPASGLSSLSGGFILAQFLPPLGRILVTNPLPVSISPEGVFGFVSMSLHPRGRTLQTGLFARFDSLDPIEAESSKVTVGGNLLVKTGSRELNTAIAAILTQLKGLEPTERAGLIAEFIRTNLDVAQISERWRAFGEWSRPLAWLCNALFLFLFAVVPFAIYEFGLLRSWLELLGALLCLTAAIAWTFRRAHLVLYPDQDEERFTQTLTILLAPTTAIRALDALSRPLLARFHPVAVLKVIAQPEVFAAFARTVLLDARYPAATNYSIGEPAAVLTEHYFRTEWLSVLEQFLSSNGLEPKTLDSAPAPVDESCLSYCPRCQAQFVSLSGECADCGGLPLRKL